TSSLFCFSLREGSKIDSFSFNFPSHRIIPLIISDYQRTSSYFVTAPKIAENENPEVIFSDINMPGINGLELARLLKSNEKVKDIVILLFSCASQSGEVFRKALEAGADDYIEMPADRNEIISRINVCIERQLSINELRKTEKILVKFKVMFESSRDAIMTLEPPSWRFTSGNPATVKMFGAKDEAEFISKEPWELSPEFQPDGTASSEKAQRMIQRTMDEGSNFFEWAHKRINGKAFFASVLLTRVEIEKDKFLIQATVRDITEMKIAEEKIKESAKEWQNTFDSIADFIFILDKDHTIRRANKVFLDFLKLKQEEVIGRKCYELIHKSDKPWKLCPHAMTMRDNKVHTEEVDDPVLGIPLLVSTFPMFDAKGEITGSVHIARDITDIKKAKDEMKERLHDLEVFHKMAVDRELMMVELKKRVAELEAKLGEKI
ncbi:MAG: PAS domain S-box protein, partial [Pseudomonadota bacterium]